MRTIDAQQAAGKSVQDLIALLQKKKQAARSMSLMALDRNGKFGVGTNVDFCSAMPVRKLSRPCILL